MLTISLTFFENIKLQTSKAGYVSGEIVYFDASISRFNQPVLIPQFSKVANIKYSHVGIVDSPGSFGSEKKLGDREFVVSSEFQPHMLSLRVAGLDYLECLLNGIFDLP